MMETRRIVANSLYMTVNLAVSAALLLATVALLGRYLGVDDFGRFVFVLNLVSLFQLFTEGGISTITVREIARGLASKTPATSTQENCDMSYVVGATATLFFVFSLVAIALAGGLSLMFEVAVSQRHTAYLLGLAALASLPAMLNAAVLRAHEDMRPVAWYSILHKGFLLGGVYACVMVDAGVVAVAAMHLAANLLLWLCYTVAVRRRFGPVRYVWAPRYWRYVLKESAPLGAGIVLRRATVHLNTFLLVWLSTPSAVGMFNSAYRVLHFVEIATVTISGVLLPALSRLAGTGEPFASLYRVGTRILLLGSALLGAWLFASAEPLMVGVYGESFRGAGTVLGLLSVALIFTIPGTLFMPMFSAVGRQRYTMRVAFFGLLTNTILGIWLIPKWGYDGAAAAALSTEALSFVVGAALVGRLRVRVGFFSMYTRVLLASIPSGALLYVLLHGAPMGFLRRYFDQLAQVMNAQITLVIVDLWTRAGAWWAQQDTITILLVGSFAYLCCNLCCGLMTRALVIRDLATVRTVVMRRCPVGQIQTESDPGNV